MTSVQESNSTANGAAVDKEKAVSSESPAPDPSNPYFFPAFAIPLDFQFNGVPVMKYPVTDDPLTHIKKVHALPMKEDDIIITAYPKCGTHWVAEILHMLTTGSTEYSGRTKEFAMLEYCDDLQMLETLKPPRLLNSHLFMAQLPKEIVEKKVKLVHIIRNAKDTAVSLYYHLRQSAPEQFTWDNFLKGYPEGKYISFCHQFEYLRQMLDFEKAHPEHPIIHIHYEDLKKDCATVIKRLSQFVGCPANDDFIQKVATACGFANMKKADKSRELPEVLMAKKKKKPDLYRKGIVGDWKNQFTVAQNEMFDEFVASQKQEGFGFTLREQLIAEML